MACPWDSLEPVQLDFCERSLCAWIKQPGNTWSNLAYIFVGLIIYYRFRSKQNSHLVWIAAVAFITGIGSVFLHMSGSYIGGCADYLGMFLGTGLLTGYNTKRWLKCSFSTMYGLFIATTILLMVLLYLFPEENRYLYGLGMPCCLIELRLIFRDYKWIDYRPYLWGWALVGIATLFWWLDVTKQFCNPDNHFISGHGIWHVLTAISFIPLYNFYSQFSDLKSIRNSG